MGESSHGVWIFVKNHSVGAHNRRVREKLRGVVFGDFPNPHIVSGKEKFLGVGDVRCSCPASLLAGGGVPKDVLRQIGQELV